MLFTSIEFLFFFAIVFLYQWYIHPILFREEERGRGILHLFLLIASYVFYMSWDYRFGALILLSTIIDYYLAIKISETEDKIRKKNLLILSLILNLVFILGFFKYYNFIAENLNWLFNSFGLRKYISILNITLPVGISFFTFQSMSYTIDVYRNVVPCEKSFVRFALFVSFFPQLVAGPIVTAKSFIYQLFRKVEFENIPFRIAIRYFFMGYFKKVIISDNISPIVDKVYNSPNEFGTFAILFICVLFAIQVYCDFSGYTDMAYSTALLLGYELPENFCMPFLGMTFTSLWRRWHISLSSWLKDYVYISLGGSKVGYIRHKFNLWATMFLAGVWHGASWNFVIWGSFQGLMMSIESTVGDLFKKYKWKFPKPVTFVLSSLVYLFTISTFIIFGIFFRSPTFEQAISMFGKLFIYSESGLRPYMIKTGTFAILSIAIGHYIGYLIYEKKKEFTIHPYLEFALYPFLILLFSLLTNDFEQPFVYFQF